MPFPKMVFPQQVFPQQVFPSDASISTFKNWTARDGMHLADVKFEQTRESFSWSREKDVVNIQEVNNLWDTETGKLPPR